MSSSYILVTFLLVLASFGSVALSVSYAIEGERPTALLYFVIAMFFLFTVL